MRKTIILCADDFGQDPHISEAILTLATNNRLSAISCMTTEEDWMHHGPLLNPFRNQLDIGLHFNLTHGKSRYYLSVNKWLVLSFLGQIDKTLIKTRLHDQLDRFEAIIGSSPDFIDGHQHVHSFPVIRDVLTQVINDRFPSRKPYVRILTPMLRVPDNHIKALIIKGASYKFSHTLDLQKISHNSLFGGVYSLRPHAPYRDFMKFWLHQSTSGTLLMCHPGEIPRHPTFDPIQEARVKEYIYLSNDAFLEDCTRANVSLGRLQDCDPYHSGSQNLFV